MFHCWFLPPTVVVMNVVVLSISCKIFLLQLEDVLKDRKRDLKDAQQKELDRIKDEHERNMRQLREDYQEKVRECAKTCQTATLLCMDPSKSIRFSDPILVLMETEPLFSFYMPHTNFTRPIQPDSL